MKSFSYFFVENTQRQIEEVDDSEDKQVSDDLTKEDRFFATTPVGLVEGTVGRRWKDYPHWTDTEDEQKEFTSLVEYGTLRGEGKGPNKKTSRQNAAIEFLRLAVDRKLADSFGIPGETLEENHDFLSRLAAPTSPSPPATASSSTEDVTKTAPQGNWIGKLLELCTKRKIKDISFTFTEEDGDGGNHVFTCTCTVNEMTAFGTATNKKTAKTFAAYGMWLKFEKNGET